MNPELSQYVTALKVQFQQQPPDYQKILKNIASQVLSLHVTNSSKASKIRTKDHCQTKGCTNKGSYDNHSKLYIGK